MKRVLVLTFCTLLSALCLAVETPPRLFFSDAKLSFLVPEPWDVADSFPYGPLLTRKTQEGTDAFIVCRISDPVDTTRLSTDTSTDVLKNFAMQDITSRTGTPRLLVSSARTLVGQNAYEITWLTEGNEGAIQYQSVYFYTDNRFYDITLRANRDSFPWVVQDFQSWLASIHFLSRQDSGKLEAPSHGGMWVHQTGGLKVVIPRDWLIAVADDRQLGATLARDKMHLALTVGADAFAPASKELSTQEKEEAKRAIEAKGYKILSLSEEPFHGYPCTEIAYEGATEDRFVRGQDLWVSSPRGRWLISLEGDSWLMRQLSKQWQGILDGFHFYE